MKTKCGPYKNRRFLNFSNRHLARFSKQDFSGCGRLRGGAGRTRTNHQSVMEHGWCPTNYPGRTPFRIAGRFAVLLDFPGFLILDQPPKRYGTWFEKARKI